MNNTIAAIVVTYNREIQLIECLKGILSQKKTPSRLYIIDNQSNEKTIHALVSNRIILSQAILDTDEDQVFTHEISIPNTDKVLPISYIRKAKNDGGAGGFYSGMKHAYEDGYDWLWMMDDDGVPELNQLDELLKNAIKYKIKYSNALVVSNEDATKLSFRLANFDCVSDVEKNLVVYNYVNSFNGTLIAREIIEKVGLVKREMFIWGDENEYISRVKKNGFTIATITTAIHKHPFMIGKMKSVIPGIKAKIVLKPKNFSKYYYRNLGYITFNCETPKTSKVSYYLHIIYFLTRFQFSELIKFHLFFRDGTKNKFDRI